MRSATTEGVVAESAFRAFGYALSAPDFLAHGAIQHHAVELRTNKTGDPQGDGRGAIEDAAAQVLRGCGGWLDFLAENDFLPDSDPADGERDNPILRTPPRLRSIPTKRISVFPVVITTARLWTASTDLSEADFVAGTPPQIVESDLLQVPWLLYQYRLSPSLKHGLEAAQRYRTPVELIDHEFMRTIAIVSSPGMADFFRLGPFRHISTLPADV